MTTWIAHEQAFDFLEMMNWVDGFVTQNEF